MTKNTTQSLSENTRKAIIIAAIVVVAVVILAVSLALILRPSTITPGGSSTDNSNSSTLPIKNGDFMYATSDDTTYPKTATNWSKYGYQAKSGSSHDFQSINNNEDVLMGIVDTHPDEWDTVMEDLDLEDVYPTMNPGLHDDIDEDANSNVYMIAAKNPTAASILSDSTSIAANTSVKITIWINTEQLADDSYAVIMIQKSTVSAKEENWYAYNFKIEKDTGWQKKEFYIFNREASSKYIRVSIGLGNVYVGTDTTGAYTEAADSGIPGSGILFVDDITYETVTANEYREFGADTTEEFTADRVSSKIIENEDIDTQSTYLTLKREDGTELTELYSESGDYLKALENSDEAVVSPFTNRDDFKTAEGEATGFGIYKVSSTGGKKTISLRVVFDTTFLVQTSSDLRDHHHFSFWIRINKGTNGTDTAVANVHVQARDTDDSSAEFKDISDTSSFLYISTEQDTENDNNCGWVKYDVYIKPSSIEKELSILFVFGDEKAVDGSEDSLRLIGDMYITTPAYEKISYKDYSSASSGPKVLKLDLVGGSAMTPSITNGSFSDLNNTSKRPASWTPVFAGDNAIYKDGQGDDYPTLDRTAEAIAGSGTIQNSTSADSPVQGPAHDDPQHNILQIKTNGNTSFGYISNNISLNPHMVYVFSVLAKADAGLNPYIYLIDNSKDSREEAVLASVTSYDNLAIADEMLLGQPVASSELGNGWARYYIVYVTGDKASTVRLALFNGEIDGTTQNKGSVYYDEVNLDNLGSYSFVDPENESDEYYEVEYSERFGKTFTELFDGLLDETDPSKTVLSGITVIQPTETEWNEMRLIPEDDDIEDEDTTTTTPATPSDVDLGLLFSVISSVALIAALLIVIVVKGFKNKKMTPAQ